MAKKLPPSPVYEAATVQEDLSLTVLITKGRMYVVSSSDLVRVKRALRTALTVATRALKEQA